MRDAWGLTPRELDVLRLLHLPRQAIGAQLKMSPSAVNMHIKNIFEKLEVDATGNHGAGRDQALQIARERGLLT